MEEERRIVNIKDFEDRYYITRSGRIISKKNNKVRHRNGDEYGYANVHLNKNRKRKLFKTFDVWKATYPDLDITEYKGMK